MPAEFYEKQRGLLLAIVLPSGMWRVNAVPHFDKPGPNLSESECGFSPHAQYGFLCAATYFRRGKMLFEYGIIPKIRYS